MKLRKSQNKYNIPKPVYTESFWKLKLIGLISIFFIGGIAVGYGLYHLLFK